MVDHFDGTHSRIMSDSITNPRYPTWRYTAAAIWSEGGVRVSCPALPPTLSLGFDLADKFSVLSQAFYRGFVPCLLRAFPTVSFFG
jgi:solute carrier family 25 carnitine/acylcarnitine transporter 20/29